MSVPDQHEYESLIAAHANRELTGDERIRLQALAAGDPARGHEIGDLEGVHVLFESERGLSGEVAAPVNMAEEADEGFQRLQAAAARSEAQLRAHLRHPDGQAQPYDHLQAGVSVSDRPVLMPVSRPVSTGESDPQSLPLVLRPWFLALAAVLIASLYLAFGSDSAPQMMTNKPSHEVLGGVRIHLDAELHADLPVLRWQAVLGASRYEASILTADGEALLHWTSAEASEAKRDLLRWELSGEQYAQLAKHSDHNHLKLRIVAFDTMRELGRSADLPLLLVDR